MDEHDLGGSIPPDPSDKKNQFEPLDPRGKITGAAGCFLATPVACGIVFFIGSKALEFYNDHLKPSPPPPMDVQLRTLVPGLGSGDLQITGTGNDVYFIYLQRAETGARLVIEDSQGDNRMLIVAPRLEASDVTARMEGDDLILRIVSEGVPPQTVTVVNYQNAQPFASIDLATAQSGAFPNAAQAEALAQFQVFQAVSVSDLLAASRETGYEGSPANVAWTTQAPSRLPMGDRLAQQQAPNAENSPVTAFAMCATMLVVAADRGLKTALQWVQERLPEPRER